MASFGDTGTGTGEASTGDKTNREETSVLTREQTTHGLTVGPPVSQDGGGRQVTWPTELFSSKRRQQYSVVGQGFRSHSYKVMVYIIKA